MKMVEIGLSRDVISACQPLTGDFFECSTLRLRQSCNAVLGARRLIIYWMMQQHPASLPPLSELLLPCFVFLTSSSSTISCGLTLICTTLGDPVLNLQSARGVSGCIRSTGGVGWTYL